MVERRIRRPRRTDHQRADVPKGTQFMVNLCKTDVMTCDLGVFMVKAPGETIPCTCRDASGMTHDDTAF